MTFRIFHVIATCLGIAAAGPALAEGTLTEQQVLEAWLSSPHADATAEAFRHWDSEAEIPGTCAVCHSTQGAVDYMSATPTVAGRIEHGVPIGSTVECVACHSDGAKALTEVLFPSGVFVSTPSSSGVCSVCHQGRASGQQVNASVAGMDDDAVSPDIRFINIHYRAAAATQLGSVAGGGYQYEGLAYVGQFAHVEGLDTCVSCHGAHDTTVKLENCTACHQGAADFAAIRTTPLDILGDGNTGVGIGAVIDQLHNRLDAAIMVYAKEAGGGPIVYSDAAYPYYFNDLNDNGVADADEAIFPNAYQSWTPRLLKAAYNYQFVGKDTGSFAHNPHYAIQLLIDSISDLAAVAEIDTTGLVRP